MKHGVCTVHLYGRRREKNTAPAPSLKSISNDRKSGQQTRSAHWLSSLALSSG